jgi:hypothetical protein
MIIWVVWLLIVVTWLELIYHFDKHNERLKIFVLIIHIIISLIVAGLICAFVIIFSKSEIIDHK